MRPKRLPGPPYNPGIRGLVAGKSAWSKPLSRDAIDKGFLGWHENGYLPHRDEPGLVQFVTFRLVGAFPSALRQEWKALIKIEDDRERRTKLEEYLDLGKGECHLRDPVVAKMVEDSLLFRHAVEYDLRAWAIMPNHVHVLFRVRELPMWKVVNAWKGFTARKANAILGRKGQFWQEGYWDTYMRDEAHQARSRRYVESNPAKAKLVLLAKNWPYSSARFRDEYEKLCLPEAVGRVTHQQNKPIKPRMKIARRNTESVTECGRPRPQQAEASQQC